MGERLKMVVQYLWSYTFLGWGLHVMISPAILIIEVRYIDEEKGKLYYFNKFLKDQTQTD
jgi:hypothetical protein